MSHEMTMRPLTEAAALAYVKRDDPIYCAGSYKIEETGIALFSRMKGDDHTGIVGLPLSLTGTLLAEVGVDLLSLLLQTP